MLLALPFVNHRFVLQLQLQSGQLEIFLIGHPVLLSDVGELVNHLLEGQDHIDPSAAVAKVEVLVFLRISKSAFCEGQKKTNFKR